MMSLLMLSLFLIELTAERNELLRVFRGEFIAIKPGEGDFPPAFTKGSGENAKKVELTEPFFIAKYEVPQNLWQAVMGENPSRWKGKRNSVEMLSYEEAQEFCRRVTELMQAAKLIEPGQVVRLPTEVEWEYAARAGTTTRYSFGDDVQQLDDYAWHTGNAKGNDPPVGAKKPNPWGLYDVHGYLWEWCSPGVVRGGSWKDKAEELVSASRREVKPDLRDDAVGLRCVLTAVKTATQATDKPAKFAPTAQAAIVPRESTLELLWGDGEFTEGPALAPDGSILFSDIGNTIYRFDQTTGKTEVFRRPSGRSNGLKFDQQGRLIACEGANSGGGRRISITTGIAGGKDGTVKTLADAYEGKRFNSPNDLAIDPQGRVYFTDPRYVGDEPRDLDFEAVYLVGTDGTVKIATREVQKPNGIIVAADGQTVYVSDNNPQGNRHLVAFSVQKDGTLADKRVLWDFGTGRGIDGMTLDSRGNIYATAGTGELAAVYVFSPEGKNLALIPTPGDPTNCAFGGGKDNSTLYITSAISRDGGGKYGLFRIKLNAEGFAVVKLR